MSAGYTDGYQGGVRTNAHNLFFLLPPSLNSCMSAKPENLSRCGETARFQSQWQRKAYFCRLQINSISALLPFMKKAPGLGLKFSSPLQPQFLGQ